MSPKLTAVSLGFGVQSVTMIVMSALGDLPPFDVAIHADTGWEREGTYKAASFYRGWLERRDRRAIIVKSSPDIRSAHLNGICHMPFWTTDVEGKPKGQMKRQCTWNFKIMPVRHTLRNVLNVGIKSYIAPETVELWLGISADEVERAAPSRVQFITHRFPLLELRMTRQNCISYLERRGLPVPIKSACVGCPFHSQSAWRGLSPSERDQAIKFDHAIRFMRCRGPKGNPLYIHSSCLPLEQALELGDRQLELFPDSECSGGCWL